MVFGRVDIDGKMQTVSQSTNNREEGRKTSSADFQCVNSGNQQHWSINKLPWNAGDRFKELFRNLRSTLCVSKEMKTTLRTLLLLTATAVCFSSFADARHGSRSANTNRGAGSDGALQRQTAQGGCTIGEPDQVRTAQRYSVRATKRESAAVRGTKKVNTNGRSRVGSGKANRSGNYAVAPTQEG